MGATTIIDGTEKPTPGNAGAGQTLTTRTAFRLILALFFVWGFLTCLNDVLLPHLKFVFDLSYAQAVAIPVTFFSTCFVFSPLAALLIEWMGYKQMMCAALLTMSVGALCFLPAAAVQEFWCFLAAIAILGAGITALQVAAAPYVSFLGPPEAAPSRFSLALGFNSLGTMIAPLFGSWLILRNRMPVEVAGTLSGAALDMERQKAIGLIRAPYLLLALSLAVLGIVVGLSRLPRMKGSARPPLEHRESIRILNHKPLLFGAITSFLYCGAEISIGSFLINYLALPDVGARTPHSAAMLVSFYWGGATLGRFLGWWVLRRRRVETMLTWYGASAGVLLTVSALSTGYVAVVSVLLIGLCNAMIVPVVVMLSISGLGAASAKASSVMTASNIGGGLVPLAMGVLADHVGLHRAYLLPVLSYAFVVFYALRGSRGHRLPRLVS